MNTYHDLLTAIDNEYDTLKILKEGKRGCVYIVRNRHSGTRYVLKKFVGSGEVYKKLLDFSCRNLPQIYEVAIDGINIAVLEEYIQGDTLAAVLSGGTLPPAQVRTIAMQVCSALWVLHTIGAVHRDIKPENIILRGNDAVLIDFDASRVFKDENEHDTIVLGTTGFAAPEQYGFSQSDERSDIFALGVLINIMLTGAHPSKKPAGGRLGRIVQKCTMTNPEKRYKSVLYLMEALS